MEQNTPIPVEYRIIRPDGSVRTVWAEAGELELDETGKPLLLRGIVHDITARKQMEEVLQAAVQLSQMRDALTSDELIASGLEEGVRLTHSAIGYCHFVHPDQNTLSLYTWSEKARQECMAGEYATDAAVAHYPLDQAGIWADCIRQGAPVIHNDYAHAPGKRSMPEGHVLLTRHLSVPVWQNDRIVAVMGVGNKPQDYTTVDIDVLTQIASVVWLSVRRKQAEAQIKEYADHLEQLVAEKVQQLELERAKVIQAGKLAALGELATGVAHELNQPLTSLLLDAEYLEIVAQRVLSGEAEPPLPLEIFVEISENQVRDIERCRRIIDHLRSFGRISDEPLTPLDINQVIADAFILTGQRLRQHNVTIMQDLAADLPLVMAHPQKLEQVFINLIGNAEYATTDMAQRVQAGEVERPGYEKTLHIRSYVEGETVCIAIRDNGSGMTPEQQGHLFEPFFTTKPVGQGTGLGLSISYGIIADFGGEITCESAANEGTTFTVCLPMMRET